MARVTPETMKIRVELSDLSPFADIQEGAIVGASTKVWPFATVRAGAVIGEGCVIGRYAYIGDNVWLGNGVHVQNGAQIYGPTRLDDEVFVGPNAVIANDRHPRVGDETWRERTSQVTVMHKASIGAGAIILPGVTIGIGATVGAGAVVTGGALVSDGQTVVGVPAR